LARNRRKGPKPGRSGPHRRTAPGPRTHPQESHTLTEEGVPAAVADAPRPSPVVSVSAESLARYPWLPARVIAGSIWRGPGHVRVRVDETGTAVP